MNDSSGFTGWCRRLSQVPSFENGKVFTTADILKSPTVNPWGSFKFKLNGSIITMKALKISAIYSIAAISTFSWIEAVLEFVRC